MKRKSKVLVSMLAVASTLALGVLGSCAGIDKISQKIKEKKCDHEEYQIVEVTEEATCVLEGERLLECVECGKTKTEKFILEHADEDGDGTCDVCDAATIELVEAENGEKAVGNTYRVFFPSNGGESSAVTLSLVADYISSMCFNFNDGKLQWKYSDGDYLPFDVVETERYIEFTVQTGEGIYDAYSIEITEDCTISFSEFVNVYRVVPIE